MSELRAGFAKVDITPDESSSMAMEGLFEQGAAEVHWPPHAHVAVFDDGSTRVGVIVLDVAGIGADTAEELRDAIADSGSLAPANILLSCTHAHNCAKMFDLYGEPRDQPYLDRLTGLLVEAMNAAASSMEPVELEVGSVETKDLTFNRRPFYAGGEVASGGPRWVEDFSGVESEADEELTLLIARRDDGSIAGGMIGFACHPHAMLPLPVWSADFAGAAAREMERRHGGTFMFVQGASGDLHWVDQRTPTAWVNWWVDPARFLPQVQDDAQASAERHAERLVEAAEAALAKAEPRAGVPVGSARQVLDIAERVPSQEQLELARSFLEDPSGADLDDFNRRITGHSWTFYDNGIPIQEMFANAILELAEAQKGKSQPPSQPVEVQVIRVGEVGFAGYPGEMFSAFGARTKKESPLQTTFPCGVTNGFFGYIPTLEAFERGGYESRLDVNSRLVPNAGDDMVDAAVELLRGLTQA